MKVGFEDRSPERNEGRGAACEPREAGTCRRLPPPPPDVQVRTEAK